jgi:FMN-dependent NADH-azoreductase
MKTSTLLIVNSSPRSGSVSRRLTSHVAEQWKQRNPDGRIIERDLIAEIPAFVSENWIQASYTPEAERTTEQKQALAQSDALIAELMAADVIVIGAPMHNFSISAPLKAWIDQIVRAGKTFSYGESGPKGLIPSEKRVLVIVSRGGTYGEGSPADFQVPYLRHMLGFVGLNNLSVVDADQQAYGAEAAQKSVDKAMQKLSQQAEQCDQPLAVSA